MQYIERNFNEIPVHDFMMNVQSKINSSKVVVEVYNKNLELIGWKIEPLVSMNNNINN